MSSAITIRPHHQTYPIPIRTVWSAIRRRNCASIWAVPMYAVLTVFVPMQPNTWSMVNNSAWSTITALASQFVVQSLNVLVRKLIFICSKNLRNQSLGKWQLTCDQKFMDLRLTKSKRFLYLNRYPHTRYFWIICKVLRWFPYSFQEIMGKNFKIYWQITISPAPHIRSWSMISK
jgi:hypothetical protein